MNPRKQRIVSGFIAVLSIAMVSGRGYGQVNVNGTNPMVNKNVWIEQQLTAQVPLDAKFQDEQNHTVNFGDFVGNKPAILVLPFYRCAGSCTLELDGLVKSLNTVRFSAGKEFNVVVVSIDPREPYTLGAGKKREYLDLYRRAGADKGWHFLTGNQDAIAAVTKSVGYRYTQDPKTGQIAHPIGLIFLTPGGKVSHYLFGTEYHPRDMTLALVDASESRIGSLSEYAALLCTHADANGKYTVAIERILRVAAGGTVLVLALFIGAMVRMERKRGTPNHGVTQLTGKNSPGTA